MKPLASCSIVPPGVQIARNHGGRAASTGRWPAPAEEVRRGGQGCAAARATTTSIAVLRWLSSEQISAEESFAFIQALANVVLDIVEDRRQRMMFVQRLRSRGPDCALPRRPSRDGQSIFRALR